MTRTNFPEDLTNLTPREFETIVREHLERQGARLEDFKTRHLERIQAVDGEYEIDVTARFRAMDVDFLVLVECKHRKSAIKRAAVQELHTKMQSTGAQKGIIYASRGFQSGAIEYARAHGIALIRVADGSSAVLCLSHERAERPARDPSLGFVLWLTTLSADGDQVFELIDTLEPIALATILNLKGGG